MMGPERRIGWSQAGKQVRSIGGGGSGCTGCGCWVWAVLAQRAREQGAPCRCVKTSALVLGGDCADTLSSHTPHVCYTRSIACALALVCLHPRTGQWSVLLSTAAGNTLPLVRPAVANAVKCCSHTKAFAPLLLQLRFSAHYDTQRTAWKKCARRAKAVGWPLHAVSGQLGGPPPHLPQCPPVIP